MRFSFLRGIMGVLLVLGIFTIIFLGVSLVYGVICLIADFQIIRYFLVFCLGVFALSIISMMVASKLDF